MPKMAPAIGARVPRLQVRPPSLERAKLSTTTPAATPRSPPPRMPWRESRKAMLKPPPTASGPEGLIGAVVAPQECPRSVVKNTRVVHAPPAVGGGAPVVIHARRLPWVAMHVPLEANPASPGRGVGR